MNWSRLPSSALAALVLPLFVPMAMAGETDPVSVFSFEDTSCGVWVRAHADRYTHELYLYWFRGFVSGYNYGREVNEVPLKAMPDNDTLSLFVDKYCNDHPLDSFIGAGFQLVKAQRVKKK